MKDSEMILWDNPELQKLYKDKLKAAKNTYSQKDATFYRSRAIWSMLEELKGKGFSLTWIEFMEGIPDEELRLLPVFFNSEGGVSQALLDIVTSESAYRDRKKVHKNNTTITRLTRIMVFLAACTIFLAIIQIATMICK
jgi:hypothetical protein